MTNSYEDACKQMKREPINPIGSCFDSVLKEVQFNPDLPENAYICHGIGVATYPSQKGMTVAHAWIEFVNEKTGQLIAADTTWGTFSDAKKYRKKFELSYVREYTQMDFMHNYNDFGYPGPWDSKIREVILSYSNLEHKDEERN